VTAERRVGLFGLLAEFDNSKALLEACERSRSEGYRDVEAYTPYPIEEVSEALGHHTSKLPFIVLIGGILGALGGFGLQYWTSVIAYPLNIGGRPLNSWIAFIPVTFETTVLLASLAAVLGMLALNDLPKPYHPVFNTERFALASRDRYFLIIAASDERFDAQATQDFLEGLDSVGVYEVEN
jgi:hypothetical protein